MIDRDALRELLWLDEGVRSVYRGPAERHALADRILALDKTAEPPTLFPSRERLPTCGCGLCDAQRRSTLSEGSRLSTFMIVCALCGNKRCPHASWHGWQCTRSNEPGQTPEPIDMTQV